MGQFEIKDKFYLNGEPFQIISGAIHYFRVPKDYWHDRLQKLYAMGCNTVETYVPWNLHEPKQGEYCFDDALNLREFIKIAQQIGLYVIVRPSPFICAEWEFGGLPAWLLAESDISLRSSEGAFLSFVAEYYKRLFQEFVDLQIDFGGPIILMQVENEFGAWGTADAAYMAAMRDIMRENGAKVPFITSDNLENNSLDRGAVEGALATINFGSDAKTKLDFLRPYTKGGPLMVTEFWIGWFDAWGDGVHHTASWQQNAADLNEILSQGASVNFYMFHGGTNPGFMNGANDYGCITPDVTSYDYDAPLSEDGSVTPKYEALRKIISKYAPVYALPEQKLPQRKSYGKIKADGQCSLFSALHQLSAPQHVKKPKSMERLGQSYGYILYRSSLHKDIMVSSFELENAADRAQVFINGEYALALYDRALKKSHAVNWKLKKGTTIDILVENLGRVNYGKKMLFQRKGIDGNVLLNGQPSLDWECYTLPFEKEQLEYLVFTNETARRYPKLVHFTLLVEEKGDTYLDLSGWGKGCVFLNGNNLGRFWEKGPQRRLYIAAPLLRQGENDLIVFETEVNAVDCVSFVDTPDLGPVS